MKMVLRCEVKHFNAARVHTHSTRESRVAPTVVEDHNGIPLGRKDFEEISC
jgi:hypothetical protein